MISQLNMNSLSVDNDETGRRFLYMNHQALSKNGKASLSQKELDNLQTARMHDDPHDADVCLVTVFLQHKSRCSPSNEYVSKAFDEIEIPNTVSYLVFKHK